VAHTWNKRNYGTNWGLVFFHWVIRLAGKRPAYFCLYFVAFAYVAFFPSVREHCRPYLIRRFSGTGRPGLFFRSYRMVLNLGKILIDNAAMGILGSSCISADFRDPGDYDRLKALNSGFIILMSHVGCWQVAISALSKLNRNVNLLMLTQEELSRHGAAGQTDKFKIINPDQFLGGTLDMLNVLKNNEILCIMGDRLFGNAAYAMDMNFLGDKALFPFSAYKLAAIAQKPIVVLNTCKTGHSEYELALTEIIHVPAKQGKTADAYKPFAKAYVSSLEAYTRDHPYQFFNFYDMWADGLPEDQNRETDPQQEGCTR